MKTVLVALVWRESITNTHNSHKTMDTDAHTFLLLSQKLLDRHFFVSGL